MCFAHYGSSHHASMQFSMDAIKAFVSENSAAFSFVAGVCATSLALSLHCVPRLRDGSEEYRPSNASEVVASHPPSVEPSYRALVLGSFLGTLGACTMHGTLDHHLLHGKVVLSLRSTRQDKGFTYVNWKCVLTFSFSYFPPFPLTRCWNSHNDIYTYRGKGIRYVNFITKPTYEQYSCNEMPLNNIIH